MTSTSFGSSWSKLPLRVASSFTEDGVEMRLSKDGSVGCGFGFVVKLCVSARRPGFGVDNIM